MRRSVFAFALVLLAACGSSSDSGSSSSSLPGHGAISIGIAPNPIVAQHVSGDTWDFPFDVVLRETGGHAVTVTAVTATVLGPGGIQLGEESWSADEIRQRGYGVTVAAGGELRYHFSPRKSVPDQGLFGGVSAELRVEGVDDTGTPTSARTTVTVTR